MNLSFYLKHTGRWARISALVSLLALTALPISGHTQPDPKAPAIYLADNLDEADGLGWCIDTLGRGFADTLHAHSCKPQGGDTQFWYNADTSHIQSVEFDGKCMSHNDPTNQSVPFGLIDCDAKDIAQQFKFDMASGKISLSDEPDKCVVVGSNSRAAGPFMSRNLILADCASADKAVSTWVFKP